MKNMCVCERERAREWETIERGISIRILVAHSVYTLPKIKSLKLENLT